MPIMRGEYAELLGPSLTRFTFQRLRERPEEYRRYTNVQTSNRAYEDSFDMEGFGPLAKKTEMGSFILDEPLKLGGVRYIHEAFGLGFAISREMRADEQYGIMARLAQSLGRSSRITSELYGHDVINNGFSTAKYVGRDGLALFSTAHPMKGAVGTQANTPTVAVDISEAAVEAAIGSFDSMTDDRGIPTEVIARFLLINPGDRMLAKQILYSAGMPGTNNNNINPLADEGINLGVSHWLTDKDSWYLIGTGADSPINFFWREAPDTNTWDDNNSGATFHTIYQRHSTGFDDWRGAWGSPGA